MFERVAEFHQADQRIGLPSAGSPGARRHRHDCLNLLSEAETLDVSRDVTLDMRAGPHAARSVTVRNGARAHVDTRDRTGEV
ncbi:hypothetical protein BLA18110_02689 [Burkholderia lata]|nr:hypothetical protein BLA18110_02689 [Burkholderia lata]